MIKRRVLIPTDNTEFSSAIFSKLEILGKPPELELVLLRVEHVVVQPAGISPGYVHIDFNPTTAEENIRHATIEKMEPEAKRLAQMGYGVRTEVGFGEPADQILFYADLAQVDLIAMTTHGREGISHFIQGSVAESVLHKAKVPVLLFRPVAESSSAWLTKKAFTIDSVDPNYGVNREGEVSLMGLSRGRTRIRDAFSTGILDLLSLLSNGAFLFGGTVAIRVTRHVLLTAHVHIWGQSN